MVTDRRNGKSGRRSSDLNSARIRRIGTLVTVVLVLAGMAVLASLSAYVDDKNDDRRAEAVREQLLDIAKNIQSCTTPEGECTKRGAEGGTNLASAITYCTLNLPKEASREQVKDCIVNELKEATSG